MDICGTDTTHHSAPWKGRVVTLHKDEKHMSCTNKNPARATTSLALNSAHKKGNSNVDKVLPCGTPQDTAHKPVAVNAKNKKTTHGPMYLEK